MDGLLVRHDLLVIHGGGNAIRVHLSSISTHNVLLHHTLKALLLGDRAVLVSQQKCLEINNLVAQGLDLCTQCIILSAEDLDFLLQVCEPLLLPLPALQCCNSSMALVVRPGLKCQIIHVPISF